MKNKHKNKERILVAPEDIPKELYARLKQYSTVKINSDTVTLLVQYTPFIERIVSLRNNFPVPKLSLQKDKIKPKVPPLNRRKPRNLSLSSCYFRPDPQSKWFNSLPLKRQLNLEKEIDKILKDLNLPLTFDWQNWLINYILYRNENVALPLYNFEPLTSSPKTPLTTEEKRVIRKLIKFRKRLGNIIGNDELGEEILRRKRKEYQKSLKTKNKLRPRRRINRDIKIVTRKKEKIKEIDTVTRKSFTRKETDQDIVVEVWPNTFGEERKQGQIVRKAREYFKEAQLKRFYRKRKT